MSALPSVADTPADTGRSCVRLFGLYTILPKVLRVVVEVLFLYHLITGFYHLEPFLRFGKHVRETASFQQKGPPLTEWPSIIVELRGLPPYIGIPPFLRRFVTAGTLSGTLRGFSRPARSGPAHGVSRAVSTLHSILIALLRRGQGTPPYAGLSCVRSTGAGHRAKQWPVAFLFHVFFTFFFRFFTFWSHSCFL